MELGHNAGSKGRALRQLTGDEKIALVDRLPRSWDFRVSDDNGARALLRSLPNAE